MTFDTDRSDAIKQGLVETVRQPRVSTAVKRRLAGAALLAAGLLVGGAVSAAAVVITTPRAVISGTSIQAPPGVIPGEPIISLLGTLTTTSVVGTTEIPVPTVPTGATHLRVTFTCIDAGHVSWGFASDGNNPSSGCDGEGTPAENTAWMDFDLADSDGDFYIDAPDGVASIVSFQFVNYVETDWGVNASGDTFGAMRDGGPLPDLLAVSIAVTDDDEAVIAYVYSEQLDDFGPDWPGQPSTPAEALTWQADRDAKYPNGWDLPAYEPDGTTRVGTFHIGNG